MHFEKEVLVVDLEATCWNNPLEKADQEPDIIEVGVCLLDLATGKIADPLGILVQPTRSTISHFCTELTTITPKMIAEQGVSFSEACQLISQRYKSGNRVWMSWGDYDRKMIENQCRAMGIVYPMSPRHNNVKLDFALRRGLRKEVGMAQALQLMNMQLVGTHHRGVDDAVNIAKLAAKIYAPL